MELIELLDHIKFVLQNEKNLVFSDNLRHYDLSEDLCVRKMDTNNHLVLNYKKDDFIGKEVARIKPAFPSSARYINVYLKTRESNIWYTGVINKDEVLIKNCITITHGDDTIQFDMPITRDQYFNTCLMYDIKVQYEEILKISEVALLLTKDRNGIII